LKAFASQDIFDETFLRVNTAKVSIPVFWRHNLPNYISYKYYSQMLTFPLIAYTNLNEQLNADFQYTNGLTRFFLFLCSIFVAYWFISSCECRQRRYGSVCRIVFGIEIYNDEERTKDGRLKFETKFILACSAIAKISTSFSYCE
jgi:hypothetical protein